jgi:hypothetical protein
MTKIFEALIDITVTKESSRIVLRHTSTNGYMWAIDAAQTCEILNPGAGFTAFTGNDYECILEEEGTGSGGQFGLYVVFKTLKLVPGNKFRLLVKVINPNLPGSASLIVASMPRYTGEILEITTVATAFTCLGTTFKAGFPTLIYGPDLSTAESTFPKLGLYTAGIQTNEIVFNSIKLIFRTSIDLPEPNDHYILRIRIEGGTRTSLPQGMVYENLVKATVKSRIRVTVDPITEDIMIDNIGALNELKTYSVGFKIALEGDEVFAWGTTFLSMQLSDSSGAIIIPFTIP